MISIHTNLDMKEGISGREVELGCWQGELSKRKGADRKTNSEKQCDNTVYIQIIRVV